MRAGNFFLKLLKNSAIGIVLGLAVIVFPLPYDVDPLWEMLQAPFGALLIVCFIGKALYDTLFYDHFRP